MGQCAKLQRDLKSPNVLFACPNNTLKKLTKIAMSHITESRKKGPSSDVPARIHCHMLNISVHENIVIAALTLEINSGIATKKAPLTTKNDLIEHKDTAKVISSPPPRPAAA